MEDVTYIDENGNNKLHITIKSRDYALAFELIDNPLICLEQKNNHNKTALELARDKREISIQNIKNSNDQADYENLTNIISKILVASLKKKVGLNDKLYLEIDENIKILRNSYNIISPTHAELKSMTKKQHQL